MAIIQRRYIHLLGRAVLTAALLALVCAPALGAGYDSALKGVQSYDAVYEVTQGDPEIANVIFWAVRDSYRAEPVQALPGDPRIVVVFHGPAVKLISSDSAHWNKAQWAEVEKFQQALRQMKKEGVKMEVCDYALKVMGVNNDTVIPEVDHVDNGFVSVIGYQMQGFPVVRVP